MFWSASNSSASIPQFWRTLAFRLTAWYACVGLFLVLAATASLYLVLLAELNKSSDLFLADKVNVIRSILRERPDDLDGLHEEVELESASRRYEHFYIRLLDEHNTPLLTTPGMSDQVDFSEFSKQPSSLTEAGTPLKGKSGHPFRIVTATAPVGFPLRQTDTIQIAVDVSYQDSLLALYRHWFWIILVVASIVFPLAGYRVAREGIQPVEEIASTARHISSTNLLERIHPEGYPQELAALAGTFNRMLDRLQDSFERISRFSGDIAHDLRTPVSNIRGEAEVALSHVRSADEYREVIESCLEEAVRLSDLIGDLLFLARAESPLPLLRRESVDVTRLLEGVREYYEISASESGVSLINKTETTVVAELDRALLQRAVGNLVSNALSSTPTGGLIQLNATAHGSAIRIEVADSGVGIPEEALPKVFDRFYRVDSSRSKESGGTGLGLAIVQSIAVLHGGSVEIASKPGEGTRVTLRCPSRPAA